MPVTPTHCTRAASAPRRQPRVLHVAVATLWSVPPVSGVVVERAPGGRERDTVGGDLDPAVMAT